MPTVTKIRLSVLCGLGFCFVIFTPVQVAYADAGPGLPPVTFNFEYQGDLPAIEDFTLFACQDSQCLIYEPTHKLYACYGTQCSPYFSPKDAPYYKLEVKFADKTRTSNVFTRVRLSATYKVLVRADDLLVNEEFLFSAVNNVIFVYAFIPALLITLITETFVASVLSKKWQTQIHGIGYANMISLPIVWFVFPALPLPFIGVWIFAEIFAFAFEATFLKKLNRKYPLTWTRAIIASLAMNTSSVLAGIVLPATVVGILLFIPR